MNTRDLALPSRRNFLTATTAIGGGLLLGFGLPTRAEVRDTLTMDAPFAPNAYRFENGHRNRPSKSPRRLARFGAARTKCGSRRASGSYFIFTERSDR